MSRLSKRLAGPAFYINVKFDQANALKHKDKNSVQYDPARPRAYHHIVNELELFDIKEGEILYTCSSSSSSRDGYARVLSSLNGVETTGFESEFIGIAQTEHKFDKKLKLNLRKRNKLINSTQYSKIATNKITV